MLGLPDGEKIVMMCLLVLTQFTNVTDTQTDTHRDTQTPYDGIGRGKTAKKRIFPSMQFTIG